MEIRVKIAFVGEQGPGLSQQAGGHGTQGLGLYFAAGQQALIQGPASRVGAAGRPGAQIEQFGERPSPSLLSRGLPRTLLPDS